MHVILVSSSSSHVQPLDLPPNQAIDAKSRDGRWGSSAANDVLLVADRTAP